MGKCTKALASLNAQRELEKQNMDDLTVFQSKLFQKIEKQKKDYYEPLLISIS